MKRIFQTIIILVFSTFLTIDSFAFFSAITKGAKVLSKLKGAGTASKVGAVSGIDEAASGALNIKKLDKNLIDEIGKTEHQKIFKAAKSSDESLYLEYDNYDAPNINDVEINWHYPLNVARVDLRLEQRDLLEPKPTIYVCETKGKKAHYFTLLPKKNIALVSSSLNSIGKQRLVIHKSSSNGTYLTTLDKKNHFVLLPDYKALVYESSLFPFNRSQLNSYKKDSSTTKLIDNAINAECYNANQEGNLQRISNDIDSQKITELMKSFNSLNSKKLTEKEIAQAKELLAKKEEAVEKERKRIELNRQAISNSLMMKIFPYLIIFYFLWEYLMSVLQKKINKMKTKKKKIYEEYVPYVNAISVTIFNLVGYIAFFAFFAFDWKTWYEIILIGIVIFYLLSTFVKFKAAFLAFKDPVLINDRLLKIYHYFNVGIPSIFFFLSISFIVYINLIT